MAGAGATCLGTAGERLRVRLQNVQRSFCAETWQRRERARQSQRKPLARALRAYSAVETFLKLSC